MSPRPTTASRCGDPHAVRGKLYICQRREHHRGAHSHGAHRWPQQRRGRAK